MIEVEKKFQPTEEQLNKLLDNSVFCKDVVNHDIIYDYPDYRLIKKSIRLRNRNGEFELKVSEEKDENNVFSSLEIENEEEIKKYFGIEMPITEFIKLNMIEAIKITTKRKKYKKDDFIIDIDDLDFGYHCVEIELLVEKKSEVSRAHERIVNLAASYGFDLKNVPAKKKEYFRIVKPEVFKELYRNQ